MCRRLFAVTMTGLAFVGTAEAADPVPPKAAKSVHLSYVLPDEAGKGVVAFYNEETVEKTTLGSYFQACGFGGGYFGIQEREDKKVGIFSVWDNGKTGNDQRAVAQEVRAGTTFVGPGVRSSRFGGEGTGGHTDFDCDWVVGQTYKFYLTATVEGTSTKYDAWFLDPAKKDWLHVATIECPDGGKKLNGLYSFIEDFRRDYQSATEVRRARYGNAWVKTADGKWLPLTKAKFTASNATWEAKDTIDAGVVGDHFYLQTGGDTKTTNALHSILTRPVGDGKLPPLPAVDAK
jgi:hypothetical protein